MRYRKKPVVIEAFQLTKENDLPNADWPQWMHDAWNKNFAEVGSLKPYADSGDLQVLTLAGTVNVSLGDYIMQDVNGELYPCGPDIFWKTHELIQEEALVA